MLIVLPIKKGIAVESRGQLTSDQAGERECKLLLILILHRGLNFGWQCLFLNRSTTFL